MKKLLFVFCFAISFEAIQAQKVYAWMDCGAKIGYGLTGLINSNLFDDRDYEHHLSGGLSYGAKVGLYMGLYNGITADFMLSSNNQKFDYNRMGRNLNHDINWKNLDIAVLYRLQRHSNYIEIGPMFSKFQKVKNVDNNITTEAKEYYNKNYYSAIFGVGGYVFGNEQFTTMLGLRLGYGLTDMINDKGKGLNYPTPNQEKLYSSKSTNAAFVQLVLEANFALGYYGRTSCSKRAHFMNFGG